MRAVGMPGGGRIILSDTVGFVSDLPTHLVAAFRATLEEVLEADVIVHVRDIVHADSEAQKDDVLDVLADLGVDVAAREAIVEVYNKIDLAGPDDRQRVANQAARTPLAVALSAITGEGCERLLELIGRRLSLRHQVVELTIDAGDGATLAWLYRVGEVLEREDRRGTARLLVSLDPANLGRVRKRLNLPDDLAAAAE